MFHRNLLTWNVFQSVNLHTMFSPRAECGVVAVCQESNLIVSLVMTAKIGCKLSSIYPFSSCEYKLMNTNRYY